MGTGNPWSIKRVNLGNRQIGAVARPECREKAQAGHGQPMQVMKRMGHQFAGLLGGRVRADGQIDRVGLAEWPVRSIAVDT